MIGLGRIGRSGKPAAYGSVEFLTVAERNIRKNDPDAKNRSESCGGKNSYRQKKGRISIATSYCNGNPAKSTRLGVRRMGWKLVRRDSEF